MIVALIVKVATLTTAFAIGDLCHKLHLEGETYWWVVVAALWGITAWLT